MNGIMIYVVLTLFLSSGTFFRSVDKADPQLIRLQYNIAEKGRGFYVRFFQHHGFHDFSNAQHVFCCSASGCLAAELSRTICVQTTNPWVMIWTMIKNNSQ